MTCAAGEENAGGRGTGSSRHVHAAHLAAAQVKATPVHFTSENHSLHSTPPATTATTATASSSPPPHLPHRQVLVLPVVAQLHLPPKVAGGGHTRGGQLLNNVARVHVDGDQRAHHAALRSGRGEAGRQGMVLQPVLARLCCWAGAGPGRRRAAGSSALAKRQPRQPPTCRPLSSPRTSAVSSASWSTLVCRIGRPGGARISQQAVQEAATGPV